jgi:hypothetical protein
MHGNRIQIRNPFVAAFTQRLCSLLVINFVQNNYIPNSSLAAGWGSFPEQFRFCMRFPYKLILSRLSRLVVEYVIPLSAAMLRFSALAIFSDRKFKFSIVARG